MTFERAITLENTQTVVGKTGKSNNCLSRKREEARNKQKEALANFLARSSVTEASERSNNEVEKQEANQLNRSVTVARKAAVSKTKQTKGAKQKKGGKTGGKEKGKSSRKRKGAKKGNKGNEDSEEEDDEIGLESRVREGGSIVEAVVVGDNESIATVVIDPDQYTEEEESEEEKRTETAKRRKVVKDKPSEMALKAAKGNRAGIQMRSDDLGCDHWGIMDMFNSGKILPRYMEHYVSEGEFLHGKSCKDCNTPASELDKTKCDPVERVYCYVCDMGLRGEVECDTFYCYPCMYKRKEKMEEGNNRRGRNSRRS